jgi:hypothetical protein
VTDHRPAEQVVWRDPPPPRRSKAPPPPDGRSSKYQRMADVLRQHPGRWAQLHPAPRGKSVGAMARRSDAFQPSDDWEIVSRGGAAYIRYVGPT